MTHSGVLASLRPTLILSDFFQLWRWMLQRRRLIGLSSDPSLPITVRYSVAPKNQCQISNVTNVAYSTGPALLGASRHPSKKFTHRFHIVEFNLLCHSCCYDVYKLIYNNHLYNCKTQLFTELIICNTDLFRFEGASSLKIATGLAVA